MHFRVYAVTTPRRYGFTILRRYGTTTMSPGTDITSFFKEPEVDVPALLEFLTAHGRKHGWDTEQVHLHVEGATKTHMQYGKRLAVKYLESLV